MTPSTSKDKAVAAAAAAAVQHQKAEKERSWPALHLLKNEKKTACTPSPLFFKSPLFSTTTTTAPTFARANEERIEEDRQCQETEGQENVEGKNKKEK